MFTEAQRRGLEDRFQTQKYIGRPDRARLADKLGLEDAQVTQQLCRKQDTMTRE